jgi:phospholipid transport system substrate-binding protein
MLVKLSKLAPRIGSLAILLATLAVVGAAWAGPPTDAVKARQTELFKLLEKPSDDANQKKVAALLDELLDYDRLAEATLGSEWATLKPEQRTEFAGLLKQLVRKAYEKNLRKILAYNVEYVGEAPAGEKTFLVKTLAKHKTDAREEPISVDFKLSERVAGKWLVVDIVTEEVSLVESYRSQFVKIVKKDGFAALITKMKDKLAKGDV